MQADCCFPGVQYVRSAKGHRMSVSQNVFSITQKDFPVNAAQLFSFIGIGQLCHKVKQKLLNRNGLSNTQL